MANELAVDIVLDDSGAKKSIKDFGKSAKDALSGKKTFAEFSREMKAVTRGDKASKVFGEFAKLPGASNILDYARNFGQAAEAAEVFAGSLGVVSVGVGGVVTGLGAAAVAAYSFSKPWMKGAANVGQLSMALGIATRDLQIFENAAARMGVSKEQADQALGGLASAAHEALYSPGGAQQRAMFGALGIDVHKFADRRGNIDNLALMQAVSAGIQSQGNAQSANRVAGVLGVSSALPALRQGPGWLRSNLRSAASFGYYSDQDVATGMAATQSQVVRQQYESRLLRQVRGQIARGFSSKVDDDLAGATSTFVGAPRSERATLYALDRSGSVNRAEPRGAPWRYGQGSVDPSGSHARAVAVMGALAAPPPPHPLEELAAHTVLVGGRRVPADTSIDRLPSTKMALAADKFLNGADKIERLFEEGGLNRYAAVGMTASGYVESNHTFNPQQQQIGGGPGRGIFQWEKPRQQDFARWAGHSIDSATDREEVAFALWELQHGGRNARRAGHELQAVSSYGDAGEIASRWYEGPAHADEQAAMRRSLAEEGGKGLDSGGHVTFDIHLHDHRTRVNVTHKDRSGRIHYAMHEQ